MPRATNGGRCKAIKRIFSGVIPGRYSDEPETNVIDLLADLRHYCDAKGLDFEHLDAIAYSHYCEENGKHQEGVRTSTHTIGIATT